MDSSTSTAGSERSVPSGRFVLRIPPELHAELRREARDAGLSLNELCARRLAAAGAALVAPVADAVRRLRVTHGDRLVGVLAYGSWARDELTEESDIDLLVVLDGDVPIARALYEEWDAQGRGALTHRIEPHFVHLPAPDEAVSGLWAEVATEGRVIHERNGELSGLVARIRGAIARGELRRGEAQGQPYWVRSR